MKEQIMILKELNAVNLKGLVCWHCSRPIYTPRRPGICYNAGRTVTFNVYTHADAHFSIPVHCSHTVRVCTEEEVEAGRPPSTETPPPKPPSPET